MILIRPVEHKDIDSLYRLASLSGPGMTSLPADKALLEKKIQFYIDSFSADIQNPSQIQEEFYMLVLEDDDRQIRAISAIKSQVGHSSPFYSYEIKIAEHKSEQLNINRQIPYLQLCIERDGPSLIGSLFVDSACRGLQYGKLISKARFLLMAEKPERFKDTVIAEMRGFNQDGVSPFWDQLVRLFFDMDFIQADYLSSQDKSFIGDLMPKHPIYIPLLAEPARSMIAKVHPETEPALKALLAEGFKPDDHVDIFDAGPRISAKISEIDTVKNSQIGIVSKILSAEEFKLKLKSSASKYLVCSSQAGFRLSASELIIDSDKLTVSEDLAKILDLGIGARLRYSKLLGV